MADYSIRDLQLKLLDVLLAVDKVCKEHNLRYYIMAGTLLGAVRHKGFIPWDDDLDIGMPRPDYELLMSKAKEWLPAQYEMISPESINNFAHAFSKIQDANTTLVEKTHLKFLGGAYIDVFPLDGVPQKQFAQKIHFARFKFLKKILYFTLRDPYKHGRGIKSWPALLCRKIFKPASIHRKLRKLMLKYDFNKSALIADYDDGIRGVMSKNILGLPTPIIFENCEVFGIEKFDKYLTQKYGDYMTIPKRENQRQHNFYYLNLDKPYRTHTETN